MLRRSRKEDEKQERLAGGYLTVQYLLLQRRGRRGWGCKWKWQIPEMKEEEVNAGELKWCDWSESRTNYYEERQWGMFQRKLDAGVLQVSSVVCGLLLCVWLGWSGGSNALSCTRAHSYQDDWQIKFTNMIRHAPAHGFYWLRVSGGGRGVCTCRHGLKESPPNLLK